MNVGMKPSFIVLKMIENKSNMIEKNGENVNEEVNESSTEKVEEGDEQFGDPVVSKSSSNGIVNDYDDESLISKLSSLPTYAPDSGISDKSSNMDSSTILSSSTLDSSWRGSQVGIIERRRRKKRGRFSVFKWKKKKDSKFIDELDHDASSQIRDSDEKMDAVNVAKEDVDNEDEDDDDDDDIYHCLAHFECESDDIFSQTVSLQNVL